MPTSWTQNYYHAVFSTKRRACSIMPELEDRLHPYIGGILRDLGATPVAINGMADHVHFLARYPSSISHSDMLRHVKGRSSKWIHDTFADLPSFGWQDGYGGFTVSKSMADTVEQYIRNQKEHHRTMSFKEEILGLLRRHGIQFNEEDVFR